MPFIIRRMICITIGCLLDLLLGDPYRLPHPVRWIGRLAGALEKGLNTKESSPAARRRRGVLFVLLMLTIVGGVTFIGLFVVYHISIAAGMALESVLCYQMLAMKCLKDESGKVYAALRAGDTERARAAVSMIVGRDTQRLDEAGIIRAAVETVAENTSDGVTAPLFYLALFGAAGGVLYKTVNTMDSMVGYKNGRYLDFGRCAARLDDIAGFLPARITALLMIAAVPLCRLTAGKKDNRCYNMKNACRIYRRDRKKHASPNAAQTEAVCAGALGIRLAGDAWYFGRRVEKPYLGDDDRPVEARDICRAHRLLYATGALMWAVCMLALGAAALV